MAAKLKTLKNTHVMFLERALGALEVVLGEESPGQHIINQHLEMMETQYSSVVTASDNFLSKLS